MNSSLVKITQRAANNTKNCEKRMKLKIDGRNDIFRLAAKMKVVFIRYASSNLNMTNKGIFVELRSRSRSGEGQVKVR